MIRAKGWGWLLMGWAVSTLIGCTQSTNCSGGSCPSGCCNAQGLCVPGTADDTCGAGGVACADCLAVGQMCFAQACVSLGGGDGGTDGGH